MTVTTASATRGHGLSPRGLVGGLLAVSVALNLCFVGGALWTRFNPGAPPVTASERFHRLAATLDLSDGQQAAYDAYVSGMLARSRHLREAIEPLLDAAWTEIGKPQPDEAKVRKLFEEAGAARYAYQKEALAATLALLGTLTPDQRGRFIADENERHAIARQRHLNESR